MNVKEKLQALLTASNNTTGETDTTLTNAVQRLVDGYGGGGGLPDWIEEMDVQTWTPTVDTNEEQTFIINMVNSPNFVIILSDFTTKSLRDYGGMIATKNTTNYINLPSFTGYHFYAGFDESFSPVTLGSTDVTATNSSVVVQTNSYGGTKCYFRAGHTYEIISIKTRAVVT